MTVDNLDLPELPQQHDDWTPRLIAKACRVPYSTVTRWCRAVYPDWQGEWRLNRAQAQKVVAKMFSYGYKKSFERQMSVK